MIARGTALRSPKEPSLLALRTVAMGEKYSSVLVSIPILGARLVSRGFGVISRADPPLTFKGFFIVLLLLVWICFKEASDGLLLFWVLGLGISETGRPIQAFDGIKLIATANADKRTPVDFILQPDWFSYAFMRVVYELKMSVAVSC